MNARTLSQVITDGDTDNDSKLEAAEEAALNPDDQDVIELPEIGGEQGELSENETAS
jgi:hypothetical protein